MTDTQLIDAIERATSLTSARRLAKSAPPGFAPQLFERLKHTVGADPQAAKRIAAAGAQYENGWGHRFEAVRLRLEHKWIASGNAFLKAESSTTDPVEGAAMAVGAIDSFARGGKVNKAIEVAERVITLLEHGGRDTDAGRASLNAGNALLWNDRCEEAVPYFVRAVQDLHGSPIEQAGAWLGLSTVQIDFGTAALVREPAERALAVFESLGLATYAAVAEQNLAQADLMCGRFDTALLRLVRLRHSLDPGSEEFARNEQHIGETYLRLNMPVEARQAFADALRAKAMRRLPYNRAQCTLGSAEASFVIGDIAEGNRAAESARVSFTRLGNHAAAALAKSLTLESNAGASHRELLVVTSDLERHSLRRRSAELLFVLAERAIDPTALSRGREIVHRHGLIDLEWKMHAATARTADQRERLHNYRHMAKAMWSARSVYQSTIARQHFLRDKDSALREYLGELLREPTPASIDEALEVIGQARSVSLIDEILGAGKTHLSPAHASRLEEIRESIREEMARQDSTDGTRRARSIDVASWRRAWHEAEGLVAAASRQGHSSPVDQTFVQTNGRYYSIAGGAARDIGDRREIDKAVRWLAFELLEPVVRPMADERAAMRLAKDLSATLAHGHSQTVMPDESLWHVPWPLMLDTEPVLSIAPAFKHVFKPKKVPDTVLVWYQPSDNLPHIQREVDMILGVFPKARLCPSLEAVRASLDQSEVDLLHIATHGSLNAWNPMFSYLQFDDGRMFAAELARAKLRPQLVTMSACEAGAVSTVESHEPDGLVRAALALGARTVVASAWPLDDRASAEFTAPYYSALYDQASVLDAVRQGRSAVRDAYSHPYYWAPMVAFGGYESP